MKKIKSILALVAALAVTAGVAQAVTPVTFSLTAYIDFHFSGSSGGGNVIQAISVNNAQLLQKIGKALNANLTTAKLCVNTNGALLVTDAAGNTLYNLSDGAGSNWVTSIVGGVNHAVITNSTAGYAYVDGDFDNEFVFWDPIFTGTQTINYTNDTIVTNIDGSLAFNVKGHALGGYFKIFIGYEKHQVSSLNPGFLVDVPNSIVYDELEISDGSAATFACSLADGVYKQSFLIIAAGKYNSSVFGKGVLFGTASLSGTQVGGETFLDPFNLDSDDDDFGNYDTFFND